MTDKGLQPGGLFAQVGAMSLAIRTLVGLVVGLAASCLVVSVGSTLSTAALGSIGRRAVALFFTLLTTAALFSAAFAWPLFARLQIDPAVAESLRGGVLGGEVAEAAGSADLAHWLVGLVPANPIQAAAEGTMLPLIFFALLLGLAIRRAGEEPRQAVLGFFQGIAEAMFVLVRWALALAPVGVFALTLVLAARTGSSIAGALAYYIAVVIALTVLFGLAVLYPVAVLAGHIPLRRFVQGTLPAQAVAFSSRSSLAALPAMVDGARTILGLGEEIAVFLVPLAGSIFRVGSAIAQTVGVLFLARLYDVPLGGAQFMTVILTVVLTTFSVPGIPGGSIIVVAPVLLACGLPLSGIALLLGIDAIPDMFRTTANVTGGMTVAVVLGRRAPSHVAVRLPSTA
ncbi:MAG: dicarboxylate/amino acid:cation symporter [Acidobacteria bacterium]|nr:dicarboxylate/amino acid:cation symporter [Acidobacteriota bacterium]